MRISIKELKSIIREAVEAHSQENAETHLEQAKHLIDSIQIEGDPGAEGFSAYNAYKQTVEAIAHLQQAARLLHKQAHP